MIPDMRGDLASPRTYNVDGDRDGSRVKTTNNLHDFNRTEAEYTDDGEVLLDYRRDDGVLVRNQPDIDVGTGTQTDFAANGHGLIFDGGMYTTGLDLAYTDEHACAVSVEARAIIESLRVVCDAGTSADEIMKP